MSLNLRAATPKDAAPAGVICHAAFKKIAEQHAFPPDFPDAESAIGLLQHVISLPDTYSVVAELDGRVVGSNFLWKDDSVGGVGPITVDPAVQNSRVGRQLMEAVLEHARLQGIAAVRLVQAAYHSRSLSLYSRLGFDVREPLALMQGPPIGARSESHVVRPATQADFAAANDLCLRVHGHTRPVALRDAIKQGTAAVVVRDGRLTGYTSGIGYFGYAVAESAADLQALIGAAPSFAGLGFLLPMRNAQVMRWCLQQGLRVVQPMTLMTMGPYDEPRGAFLPSILY